MPTPSNPQAPTVKPDLTRMAREVLQILLSKGIPPIPANYEQLFIQYARKSGVPEAVLERLRGARPAPTHAAATGPVPDVGEEQAAATVLPSVLKLASLDSGLTRSVRDLFLRVRILAAQDRLEERAHEVVASLQSVARRSLSGRLDFDPDELLRVFTPPPDSSGNEPELEGPVHTRVLSLVLRVCITQGKAPDMRSLFQRLLKLVEMERLAQRYREVEGALKALGGDASADVGEAAVVVRGSPDGVQKELVAEVCGAMLGMMRPAVEHSRHAAAAFDKAIQGFEGKTADPEKALREALDLSKQYGRHFQSIPEQRRQMKELVGILMQSLRSVSYGSDAFTDRLGRFEETLTSVDAPEELDSLRDMLVQETQALSQDVRTMREEFQTANDRVKRAHKQIAQLQTELGQARDVALMDPLTAVANRRGFDEWIERTLKTEDGSLIPFAFLVFDVDHFKRVNDTWGHMTGDQVLVEVARRIGDGIRGHDIVSRWGGEEFCVGLPGGNVKEAMIVAERVLEKIRCRPITTEAAPVPLTASVGVAEHRSGEPVANTFDRADQALYLAKESGRDKCCTERDVTAQAAAE